MSPAAGPSPSVAHLTPYPVPGAPAPGVPAYAAMLLPALADAGVTRQVVVAQVADGPVPTGLVPVVRRWRPGPRFAAAAGAVTRTRPQVCHAQHEVFLYGGAAGAALFAPVVRRIGRRCATVVSVHGVVDLADVDAGFARANGSRLPPAAIRASLRHFIGAAAGAGDLTIVHGDVFRDRLVAQYGICPERIRVVPLLVPEAAARDRVAERESLGFDGPVALFFGFVTGYKDIPLLLEAWRRVRRARPDATLVVAGGRHPRLAGTPGYEREYAGLMSTAARIGGVDWKGFLDDDEAARHLAASDLLVLPYREALAASGPMGFALAHGLPVAVSRALGPLAPDPGAVFAHDPDDAARVITEAFTPAVNARLAAASRRAAGASSLTAVARRTVDVYREVAP